MKTTAGEPQFGPVGLILVCIVSCGGKATFDRAASGGAGGLGTSGSSSGGSGGSDSRGGSGGFITTTGGVSNGGSSDGTSGANSAGGGGGTVEQPRPSCADLAPTCGSRGDADCCASSPIPGGSFERNANGQIYPATISDFVLDEYEITVGRFRKFVAAYSPNMIPEGAGKNPNNPQDPGWNSTWSARLPADATALVATLKCDESALVTWTDNPGSPAAESLPVNCLSWYAAEAFCIWDQARLPTQAEWTYAASGGAEQRRYPWGDAEPDCSYANYRVGPGDYDFCTNPGGVGAPNRVGSESSKGNAKWGHADLAGNLTEWMQDYARFLPSSCNDCAALDPAGGNGARRVMGGSFMDTAQWLHTTFASPGTPNASISTLGARCVKSVAR